MMSLERWQVIKKLINNDELFEDVYAVIESLVATDIITTRLFARKTHLHKDQAKEIIRLLINNQILGYFIVVTCINPNTRDQVGEIQHYKAFNSLDEFNRFTLNPKCMLCGCGYEYDVRNAKIGFRRIDLNE